MKDARMTDVRAEVREQALMSCGVDAACYQRSSGLPSFTASRRSGLSSYPRSEPG
jgi:hypothetical protein